MTSLTFLDLRNNELTDLTLPSGLTQLASIFLEGNPLTTLVLSEPLAARNLARTIAPLEDQGVSVFTYPLTISLVSPQRRVAGAFEFTLIGPPGVYAVLGSADLAVWSDQGTATNKLGSITFTDADAGLSSQKFYHARSTR